MAYTAQDLSQYVEDLKNQGRQPAWSSQNDISYERGLHHKYDHQLVDAIGLYERKIGRLIKSYADELDELTRKIKGFNISKIDFKGDVESLKDKILRLAEKYWVVKWEIEGRNIGQFKRKPVGTTYYIDLDGGNDGADGLGTGTAWLTLEKYTTVTVRTAGDIALIRANTSQVNAGAQVEFDEDGNADNPIYIIGCDSVVNDPWTDGSDVKPIYDFNAGAHRMSWVADNFWSIQRMDVKNSTHGNAMIWCQLEKYIHFKDCVFQAYTSPGDPAVNVLTGSVAHFDGCNFHDNDQDNLRVESSTAYVTGCALNGGSNNDYGIYARNGGICYVVDSDLGQSTAHGVSDFKVSGGSRIFVRNCNWVSGTAPVIESNYAGRVIFEDDDEVYGDHTVEDVSGKIEKETTIVRSGGGSSSIKMTCKSPCGIDAPLQLSNHDFTGAYAPEWPYRRWMSAAQHTITIYIRGISWTGFPTAPQLYIEASYLNHATNATRTKIKSNDVLADNITWTAFDVTFTPGQAGFVYLNVFLKHHEAACGVYVDAEPVIS